MRWVRRLSIAVVVLGIAAAAVLLTPAVYAQIMRWSDGGGQTREFRFLRAPGGQLGVAVRDVESADASREKLSATAGAVIEEVRRDSPAAKAGLKVGDIVVELDAERVRSAAQFSRLVRETPAGRTVKLGVMRDGKRSDVDVKVEERSAAVFDSERMHDLERELRDLRLPEIEGFTFSLPGSSRARLGIQVEELTPQLAAYFGAKDGVLVVSVDEGSPAAKAGIKAGDVITAVSNTPVGRQSDLVRELRRAEQAAVKIDLVRDRKATSVTATLEQRDRPRRSTRRGVPI